MTRKVLSIQENNSSADGGPPHTQSSDSKNSSTIPSHAHAATYLLQITVLAHACLKEAFDSAPSKESSSPSTSETNDGLTRGTSLTLKRLGGEIQTLSWSPPSSWLLWFCQDAPRVPSVCNVSSTLSSPHFLREKLCRCKGICNGSFGW